VLRATRELGAYFKGGRTEREARAALKIIKAFVRERERQDPKNRTPLPGIAKAPAGGSRADLSNPKPKPKRKGARRVRRALSKRVPAQIAKERPEEFPERSDSDEPQD
jgi:hypothetical protein